MNPRVRLAAAFAAAAGALALGVAAAWPIYATGRLWLVALAGLVLGGGLAWARDRWRLALPVVAALLLVLFAATVVPVAVPDSLGGGWFSGLVDALAAIALGWKQLLTLSLPVGGYRTVLVPAYVVMIVTALLVVLIGRRPGRRSAFAAIPMLLPVAFGTVFGASEVSAPLALGPLRLAAPREIGLWLAAAALAAVWVVWTSGAQRRRALRLGRSTAAAGDPAAPRRADAPGARGGIVRGCIGAGIVVVALGAGAALAPVLDAGARAVPRDRIDPEIVVRERPSPLASYRGSKRDDAIDRTLFTVTSDGALPDRLRLAVLDVYDGVDFHVGDDAAGRFTRFPSGTGADPSAEVTVEVGEGYRDIWAPIAPLAARPSFSGERADALADGFYVNRDTGGAIAVPDDDAAVPGLRAGDGYTAEMAIGRTAPVADAQALGGPARQEPLVDLEALPELAEWIERQGLGDDAAGLGELVQRLRDRGYLSHSMSEGEGETVWLERLSAQYGTTFESSAGGHSEARVEELFEELNEQQAAAGEEAKPAQLVAAIGDDEQFAAAAALVAQALGYESRVVVGFRLDGEGVPGVPACAEACTGETLAAWIEVRGDRGAWVAYDVTPQVERSPQRIEEGEELPEFSTTPEERDVKEVDPPIGLGEQNEGEEQDDVAAHDSWLWPVLRIAGLTGSALALLAIPICFLPLAKRRRARRRRGAAVPELRALGAWEEMLDRARDAGVRLPAGTTRGDVGEALGTAPAIWAAGQVDRAVFSPHGISSADADELWRAVDADSAERASGLGRFARLRARYSLRSYRVFGGGRAAARSEMGVR